MPPKSDCVSVLFPPNKFAYPGLLLPIYEFYPVTAPPKSVV
jgi:hypothetical protein